MSQNTLFSLSMIIIILFSSLYSNSKIDGARTARDDRRRATHNEVERRRRDKINNWIVRLSKLVPDCATDQSKSQVCSRFFTKRFWVEQRINLLVQDLNKGLTCRRSTNWAVLALCWQFPFFGSIFVLGVSITISLWLPYCQASYPSLQYNLGNGSQGITLRQL